MHRTFLVPAAVAFSLCFLPAVSHAALAKKAGAAGTSSSTSSNPTVKAQSNLMDPSLIEPDISNPGDPAGTPLTVTFARLDVEIQFSNMPPTLMANNIIQSISVTPYSNVASDPNFQPSPQTAYAFKAFDPANEPLPAYNFDTTTDTATKTSNVVFNGDTVFLHDIAVELDPNAPAPLPGDVNTAEVHVQYFNFPFFGGVNYNDIIATYTTLADETGGDDGLPASEIDGVDSQGVTSSFIGPAPDPNNPDDPANDGTILPSTSIQTLGGVTLPEPAMLGSLGMLVLLGMRKRRAM
jgi:hypothetical protein